MNAQNLPRWLNWSMRLQAIAQTGLTFAQDPYDIERYQAIREIAAEILAEGTGLEIAVLRNLVSADAGYATPKVDVRGAVFRDGKILLVQEKSDSAWTLPGGWADVCESPAGNVVREIREESGFDTRATKILAFWDRSLHPHHPPFPFHVYKLFVRCEIVGGTPTPGSETENVDFFAENELPELSLTRVTPGQIHRLFEHYQDPTLLPDFD
jgi:ADP-ribose pyrophosphatase YjhB (NUDIX family)